MPPQIILGGIIVVGYVQWIGCFLKQPQNRLIEWHGYNIFDKINILFSVKSSMAKANLYTQTAVS